MVRAPGGSPLVRRGATADRMTADKKTGATPSGRPRIMTHRSTGRQAANLPLNAARSGGPAPAE